MLVAASNTKSRLHGSGGTSGTGFGFGSGLSVGARTPCTLKKNSYKSPSTIFHHIMNIKSTNLTRKTFTVQSLDPEPVILGKFIAIRVDVLVIWIHKS